MPKETIPRSHLLLLAFAAAVAAATVGAWAWWFSASEISPRAEDWAFFGSYVGGLLSPVLGAASLIGLLLTLRQQSADAAKSLRHAQESAAAALEQSREAATVALAQARDAADQALSLQREELSQVRQSQDDKDNFEYAVTCWERAYITISSGAANDRPVSDRLAWIATARLLLAAEEASAELRGRKTGVSARLAGEEEHWQHRFYLLFTSSDGRIGLSRGYFDAASIPEQAIRVVFQFFSWPESRRDRLEDIEVHSEEELQALGPSMLGVREHLLSRRASARARAAPQALRADVVPPAE